MPAIVRHIADAPRAIQARGGDTGQATDFRTEYAPLRTGIHLTQLYAELIALALEADTDAPRADFLAIAYTL